MASIHDQQCYCNVKDDWYTPRRIENGWGACPYCTAYRQTVNEPADYSQPHPQWHPILSTVEATRLRARLLASEVTA